MSPADLATLSLLDPDQGVCPNGHPCRLSDAIGNRECSQGEYRGLALICWEISSTIVESAEAAGARAVIVGWARSFLASR
jgi:hypothetical protein